MTDSFFVNTIKKNVFSAVASRYGAVLIPSAPGALYDLAQDNELAKLLNTFVQEKSECMQLLVYFSRHAWGNPRQSWILDSRFQALNSRFLVSGTWIPDISSHWWDSVHFPWAVMWIVCCLLQCFFYYLEPICAVGHGVAGLCSARREDRKSWSFKSYSLTGVT